jgi:hypothetical protein
LVGSQGRRWIGGIKGWACSRNGHCRSESRRIPLQWSQQWISRTYHPRTSRIVANQVSRTAGLHTGRIEARTIINFRENNSVLQRERSGYPRLQVDNNPGSFRRERIGAGSEVSGQRGILHREAAIYRKEGRAFANAGGGTQAGDGITAVKRVGTSKGFVPCEGAVLDDYRSIVAKDCPAQRCTTASGKRIPTLAAEFASWTTWICI